MRHFEAAEKFLVSRHKLLEPGKIPFARRGGTDHGLSQPLDASDRDRYLDGHPACLSWPDNRQRSQCPEHVAVHQRCRDNLDLATPSIAFRVDDLAGSHATLTGRGVPVTDIGEHGGTASFAFSDPEGHWFAVTA